MEKIITPAIYLLIYSCIAVLIKSCTFYSDFLVHSEELLQNFLKGEFCDNKLDELNIVTLNSQRKSRKC